MRELALAAMVALAASAAACSMLGAIRPAPDLFGDGAVESIDFESDRVAAMPKGFRGKGGWKVVDSPTAASGEQVLVRDGESAAALAVRGATGARRVSAEASVRVLVGSSGAGLHCRSGGSDVVHAVALDADAKQVVLRRERGGTASEIARRSIPAEKGDWVRLGIRCDGDRVVAYVNGESVAEARASLTDVGLGLWTGGGVVAQFDDLRYASSK